MNIKNRIQEFFKNIARRILQKELLELHDQLINVTEQKRTWKNRYEGIIKNKKFLPISALVLIEKLLPDANKFANGIITIEELGKGETKVVETSSGIIRGRICEVTKNSVVINIDNWCKIKIPIVFKNFNFGAAEVDSYAWDFINSEIGGVFDSNATFNISTFLSTLNSLSDEN